MIFQCSFDCCASPHVTSSLGRCIQVLWWQQGSSTTCWTSCTWLYTSVMYACSWLPCSVAWRPSPLSCWRGSCGTRVRGSSPPASLPSYLGTFPAPWLGPSTMRASPSLPCSSPTSYGWVCVCVHVCVRVYACTCMFGGCGCIVCDRIQGLVFTVCRH